MLDLVAHLRKRARHWPPYSSADALLDTEAADEIERLRSELSRTNAALSECHKEIFKLRDELLSRAGGTSQ